MGVQGPHGAPESAWGEWGIHPALGVADSHGPSEPRRTSTWEKVEMGLHTEELIKYVNIVETLTVRLLSVTEGSYKHRKEKTRMNPVILG